MSPIESTMRTAPVIPVLVVEDEASAAPMGECSTTITALTREAAGLSA